MAVRVGEGDRLDKLVMRPSAKRSKRLLDIVVGSALAVLAIGPVLLVAIVSGLSLRSWPFFAQERIGRGGRSFRLLKIRTLPRDHPPYHLKTDARVQSDKRVLEYLRRSRLDELPQLFLVPLGILSLVGPRPKMPDEFEPADAGYIAMRTTVPQGCSGLWQIGTDTDALPGENPQYDAFYLRHWTIRLDLWVLARTCLKLLGIGDGVALERVPPWTKGRGLISDYVRGPVGLREPRARAVRLHGDAQPQHAPRRLRRVESR